MTRAMKLMPQQAVATSATPFAPRAAARSPVAASNPHNPPETNNTSNVVAVAINRNMMERRMVGQLYWGLGEGVSSFHSPLRHKDCQHRCRAGQFFSLADGCPGQDAA